MAAILDSSALLALLWSEQGSDAIAAVLDDSMMSAVNLAEVHSKLADRGVVGDEVGALLGDLPISIVDFDSRQAAISGELRGPTRSLGLSLGDRACLALAIREGAQAVSADKTWKEIDVDVEILLIR